MLTNIILNFVSFFAIYMWLGICLPILWDSNPIAITIGTLVSFLLWNIPYCIRQSRTAWAIWGYVPKKEYKEVKDYVNSGE